MGDTADFVRIKDCEAAVHGKLLALNNTHKEETSFLTDAEWQALVGTAFAALTTRSADAFLIACDQTAQYTSPNFLWFRDRYDRFIYVDRIVVASSARGQGLARRFYAALEKSAGTDGHKRIVCEVNTAPPNPISDAFHQAMGFEKVGQATLADRGKSVRYLQRMINPADRSG